MPTGPVADDLIAAVASACRSGLDAEKLRAAILPRLRKAETKKRLKNRKKQENIK